MLIDIHAFALRHLAARAVPWAQVARETEIPYETLKKIASGRTPNPGVVHVQRLADYFAERDQMQGGNGGVSPPNGHVSTTPTSVAAVGS
jgi:hypothetical protein